MQLIKFGTDGFRGIISDNFTFDNVRRITKALAVYLHKDQKSRLRKGVVIGFDNRFLSGKFAETAADVLSDSGIPVLLSDRAIPTQAVSFFVRKHKHACGVAITASHNPYDFNGFKIKDKFGASSSKQMTKEIESIIRRDQGMGFKGIKKGKIKQVNVVSEYIEFLKQYLDVGLIKKNQFNITVDSMHGVGAGIIDRVLKTTKCKINTIRKNRDILFGGVNPEPIAQNLGKLKSYLKENDSDLAIALDGDADRVGAMCPDGTLISSHFAICLLLLHLIENKKMSGKVIKSLTTTALVDKIASFYGLKLEVVPVGFKNIAVKMINEDILIGGEESGGIGFKNYMPERDGILSGLLLIELMAFRRQPIADIIKDMRKRFGKYEYLRQDLKIDKVKKIIHPKTILGKKVVDIHTYDGTKFVMEDESWLLIRPSGTEPVVRIYAESLSSRRTKKLIEYGCRLL